MTRISETENGFDLLNRNSHHKLDGRLRTFEIDSSLPPLPLPPLNYTLEVGEAVSNRPRVLGHPKEGRELSKRRRQSASVSLEGESESREKLGSKIDPLKPNIYSKIISNSRFVKA